MLTFAFESRTGLLKTLGSPAVNFCFRHNNSAFAVD
jgi:hypothetical protein